MIIPGVEVDEERLAAICDKYARAELRVFGSRARGGAEPDIDIDIDILYTLRPGRRLGWKSSSSPTNWPTCSAAGSTW